MAIELQPEHEARIADLAARTGRAPAELLGEVIDSYFAELAEVRETLDRRYREIQSGLVKPVAGEEVFERLRRKSDERRASHS